MARGRRRKKWEPERGIVGELDRRGRAILPAGEGGRPREARVDGALPGESVELLRSEREGINDAARTVQVFEPAATRVDARCTHYGLCGGCSLMHMDHDAQIAFKQAILLADFAAHGLTPERVLPALRGPAWGYRRRARLGAKLVPKKGKVLVGFREKDRRFVADLSTCEVLASPANAAQGSEPASLIPALGQLIESLSIASRTPQIEVSVGDDELALVFRVLDPPSDDDLDRLREFERERGVRVFLQPGGLDTVAPLDPARGELLSYSLPEFDVKIEFRPTDFVQVNAPLNRAMISRAVELLELEHGQRVLDLFCGLGNFSLPIARRLGEAGHVVGIEGDAALVERARANAAANQMTNLSFEQRDLYRDPAALEWPAGPFDRVLLDPPRSGAAGVIEDFERIAAKRVVYVACSPETLARDAATLVSAHGYRLLAAGVMDMFPHTAHVESIAVFER
ncbi:23S rRNA (uracil(1939)-C(5))-methyltransferase RlmD [Enhygromyxa salina]|uniref:23S rRNA (Uracil(1939)-C(5))-methyltransferase RlmD n=1 Tax=Enhygromyxa salina TaxID=215803 RepID=A0A2S9XBZ0_9BACT|nr:23S rRNA (uracil(1939)-C(5))-methyltransferase RlmD [Enhygromyxa salina]PRP90372.1 23S rRNA (uracil(1939)-C(5))-methyltransferase RlmD [Enhygromyxa salina]